MVGIFAETEQTADWRDYLKELNYRHVTVSLPDGDELLEALRYLEIPEEDVPAVVDQSARVRGDKELWWYVTRAVWSLIAHMGRTQSPPRFARLRDINDPNYRFFYVLVYVAALPHVRSYHRRIGIPEDIAQATLADVGRNVRVHRKREGLGGLGVAWWLMLHFRGVIYQLGRLQFERTTMNEPLANSIREAGGVAEEGSPILSIHIPDFSGGMTPEACEASFDLAREFFSRHFPDTPYKYAMCNSWLLDPRLREHLRPESNIVRFQDRFSLIEGGWDSTLGIMQFVFGRTPADVASVPRHTSLQKAVAEHIDAGGIWHGRSGWFKLQG